MDAPDLSSMPGGPFGALGAAAAAVLGGFVFLRQYLSRGAADRADDAGRVSAINVYKELLEAERAARVLADRRADDFARERNDAITLLGNLKGQIDAMQRQLQEQTSEIGSLQEQIHQLKGSVNAKA